MGDNNAVMVQIVAVALFLFFCFVTYMNTKTWRATQVVFLFLTFVATLVFVPYAALVLKARKAWTKKVEELDKTWQATQDEAIKLTHGDVSAAKLELDNINTLKEEIRRTIVDRGRVWRDCKFVDATPSNEDAATGEATMSVNLDTTPEGAAEGQKVEPHHMEEKTIVYAFKSGPAAAPPYIYVSQFQAAAVTDTSISLISTVPLTKEERNLCAGAEPWVLYEVMPIDSHAVFTHADANVPELMRGGAWLGNNVQTLQAVMDDYQRDGGEVKESDPPSQVFAKVTFKQDYTLRVDDPETRSPLEGQSPLFNTNGEAIFARLKHGETGEVQMKTGDTAELIYEGTRDANGTVLQKGAKELADEGVVQIDSKVYRRKLNDYANEFHLIWVRRRQIKERIAELNARVKTLDEESALAKANTVLREEEAANLTADIAKADYEKTEINKYVVKLDASYRKLKSEMSALYRENTALHSKILAANEDLTRAIDARTARPTSTKP